MNIKRIFVKDLNANDTFRVPGSNTDYTCVVRSTMDNMTRVTYRLPSGPMFTFSKVNLSTVDLLTD